MSFKIALDGPSSAGKSTIAKLLAKELGYTYIDTGAMYRAFGLYFINNAIDFANEIEISKYLDKIDVKLDYDKDNNLIVYLNGEDVTNKIRNEEVGNAASVCSQFQNVRDKLVAMQRKLAEEKSCIMDGRDIASNVLPNANLKFFVNATIECRTERRYRDELAKGINTTIDKVRKELEERDYRDTNRKINPLRKMPDSIDLDTTGKTGEEMVDKILREYF